MLVRAGCLLNSHSVSFTKRGRARVFREELAGNFVSFESTVTIEPGALCRVGVFVSRERSRRGSLDVQNEVAVARHHDGSLQTRVLKRSEGEQEWTDVSVINWETGEPTILRIERLGESTKTTFRLLVDGVPVADGLRVPGIGATTEQLRFGVFVEGEILWRLISHLSLNYLSLADSDLPLGSDFSDPNQTGAGAMRDLLKIYGHLSEASTRKQIEGLRSIRSKPITRRTASMAISMVRMEAI